MSGTSYISPPSPTPPAQTLLGNWRLGGRGEQKKSSVFCCFSCSLSATVWSRRFVEAFISLSRSMALEQKTTWTDSAGIIEHLNYDMIYMTDKLHKPVSGDSRTVWLQRLKWDRCARDVQMLVSKAGKRGIRERRTQQDVIIYKQNKK